MRTAAIRHVAMLVCCALAGCTPGTPSPRTAPHPDFAGVWSGTFTTEQDEFWQLEDLTVCSLGCTPAARAYLASLIEDPANDATPVQELVSRTTAFMREELANKSLPEGVAIQTLSSEPVDPALRCVPHGLARAAVSPLPLEFRQDGANLKIAYQEWSQSRTIYLDGTARPTRQAPTQLGHSVGRYDGETLVVETTGIAPNRYHDTPSGGGHSAEAKFVERYAIAEEPRRLELQLSITDPVTLLEPQVIRKAWLATPDVQLVDDRCADVPGSLPEEATLEERRRR